MANVMIDQKVFLLLVKMLNGFNLSSDELVLVREHLNDKLAKMANRQQYTNSLNNKETPS